MTNLLALNVFADAPVVNNSPGGTNSPTSTTPTNSNQQTVPVVPPGNKPAANTPAANTPATSPAPAPNSVPVVNNSPGGTNSPTSSTPANSTQTTSPVVPPGK